MGCTHNTKTKAHLEMAEATDQWHFFPCSMGKDQAFIYLNTGISDTIRSAPPSLAKLRLTYKAPRDDGLPTNAEFEPVNAIEDQIEAYSDEGNDWYVGRVTVGGHRIFYVYTSRGEPSWMQFMKKLGTETGYDIRLAYQDDPDHRGYYDELYPTEDDWQVIADLQVIESLEGYGDDGSESRKIDHWIYFDDKPSSVDFVIWAENDRFTEEPEHSHETDDGKYCVRLFHHGTLTIGDISSHTIALRRKAAEYGGAYAGWETPIQKPKR